MADYLIRPAETRDLDAVAGIYNRIHDAEEQGRQTIGWLRDVYPVRQTAQAALDREELYVLETEGSVLGAAILNRTQVITYAQGHWAHDAPEEQVLKRAQEVADAYLLRTSPQGKRRRIWIPAVSALAGGGVASVIWLFATGVFPLPF